MNISGNLAAQRKVVNLQDTTKTLKVEKQEDEKQVQQATQQSTQAANYGNATTEQYLANMGINIVSTNKTPQVVDIKPELIEDVTQAAIDVLNELGVAERSDVLAAGVRETVIGQNNQTAQTKGFMDFFKKIGNAVIGFLKNPGVQIVIDVIDKVLDVFTPILPALDPIHRGVHWANGLA